MTNYQAPKTSHPIILAPWSIHLTRRVHQMAGRGRPQEPQSPRFQNIIKAFPKAPSVSSASYLLLALSDADSAGSPHSTNTSFLCFFSVGGGYFSAAAHKIQNGFLGLHLPFRVYKPQLYPQS